MVIDFVRENLAQPHVDFYLYVAPPVRKLDAEASLLKNDLVPASVVNFALAEKGASMDPYLQPGLLAAFGGSVMSVDNESVTNAVPTAADKETVEQATTATPAQASQFTPARRPDDGGAGSGSSSSSSGGKKPKWLKL